MDVYLPRIINDIINLRKETNLAPIGEGETYETLYNWYSWALSLGLVETVYEGDKLTGFLEWIKLDEIPNDQYRVEIDYSKVRTAPILCIINCAAINRKTFIKLRHKVYNSNPFNPNEPYVFWHKDGEPRDKFRIYRRVR